LLGVLQDSSRADSANDILSAVLEDVAAFRARAPQTDDVAVVILKRETLEAPAV
jgi:serine phosphatase RsbU (regulator of sigma subunit)